MPVMGETTEATAQPVKKVKAVPGGFLVKLGCGHRVPARSEFDRAASEWPCPHGC